MTARIQEKFVDKPLALRYFKHLKVGYLKDSVFYRDYTVIKSKKGNKIHADVGDITGVDVCGLSSTIANVDSAYQRIGSFNTPDRLYA